MECPSVVASIFVNPTQFGPNEDLARYPRDLPRDLALLEAAGMDLVWTPTVEVMYPSGFQTWVQVEELTRRLEGEMRPGHFRGVTTVVTKLFHAVGPDKAYFGQKDAQQAAVVRRMTKTWISRSRSSSVQHYAKRMGWQCPVGIYISTPRSARLRLCFFVLSLLKAAYDFGERNAENLRVLVAGTVADESLARLQYVSCADYETLEELETIHGKALLSIALVGKTRLIDNFIIG